MEFNHTTPIIGLTIMWAVVIETAHRITPTPKYVRNTKLTEKEKRKEYLYYAGKWVGIIHGVVTCIVTPTIVYLNGGYEFGTPNTPMLLFPIYVRRN